MFVRSHCDKRYQTKAFLAAFFMLIVYSCSTSAVALDTKEVDALRPLVCEGCVPKSKLRIYYGHVITNGQSRSLERGVSPAPEREPTEDEVSKYDPTKTALVAPDDVRPTRNAVCLGSRIADVPIEGIFRVNGSFITLVRISDIKSVCVGELKDLELFLQGVVDAMFMSRLQKYEDALNKAAIDAAIKASMQDVVFQYQTQWAAKVKADVLAELGHEQNKPVEPPQVIDNPSQCNSGNFASCPSKPKSECCMCLETDGAKKFGTCIKRDNGTWEWTSILKPEDQNFKLFRNLREIVGLSPQTSLSPQSDDLQETYRGPCSGSVQDSSGNTISCPGERPLCFSDGTCTCDSDSACD